MRLHQAIGRCRRGHAVLPNQTGGAYRCCVEPNPPALPSGQVVHLPGRNPFAWFAHSWRHYADFAGRARRREWWSFWFINCIPSIVFAVFAGPLESMPEDQITLAQSAAALSGLLVLGIYWLAALVPFLSVTARRFHDIGMNA